MKLLLDENLSFRLVAVLAADFSGTRHVRDLGLLGATDQRIWELARQDGFVIVSKDSDFRQRSFVQGAPPQIVWLDVGNDGTQEIGTLLLRSRASLLELASNEETALLVLSKVRASS